MLGSEVGYSIARILGPALGIRVKPRAPSEIPSIDAQVRSIELMWPANVVEIPPDQVH